MDQTKKNIILIGGGGHCKSCIELIRATGQYNIRGILDLPSELGKNVLGIEVVGTDDDYSNLHNERNEFLVTVGQIKTPETRIKIFEKLKSINARIATVIAPTAYVAGSAIVEEGSVVMHNTFVNAGVKIGVNNIINTGAIIEHDAVIGNHNHISTGSVINGDCIIGNGNFIGSGSCLVNGIRVNDHIVIGAGSIVINHLLDKGSYVGNPAKRIK